VGEAEEYILMNHSVIHSDYPPRKGHIRGTSHLTGIFILVKKGRSYHALRIRIQLNFILVGRVNLRKQHLSNPSLKTERTCSLPTWHIEIRGSVDFEKVFGK